MHMIGFVILYLLAVAAFFMATYSEGSDCFLVAIVTGLPYASQDGPLPAMVSKGNHLKAHH